jgi:hypothetical protein
MAISRSDINKQVSTKSGGKTKKPKVLYRKPKVLKGSWAGGNIRNYDGKN